MKPIMSFWSVPYLQNKHNKWIHEESFNLSWILSVESITKKYGKPFLYTDDAGEKFLTQKLNLKFESIDKSLNDLDSKYCSFFSLGKIFAIGVQDEPFIHFDYDLYIFDIIPRELFQNGLLFQREAVINFNKNINHSGSPIHRPDLLINKDYVPDWWKNGYRNNMFKIFQTGIIGGTNIEFFTEYSNSIFNIINSASPEEWNQFDAEAKHSAKNHLISGYGYAPSYTLEEYTLFALAKKYNLSPRFLINSYNIPLCKFSHVSFEKKSVSDLQGRIVRRILSDHPHQAENVKEIIPDKNISIPKVSLIIISEDKDSSIYETILKAITPRKIRPDEVIVSEYLLNDLDKKILSKIESIKIVPGGDSFGSSLRNAFKRSRGDLIIVVNGLMKTPRMFIEKSIATYIQRPESVFCAASTGYKELKDIVCYGATKDEISTRPNASKPVNEVMDFPLVDALHGGMYIFSSKILHKIFSDEKDINSLDDINNVLQQNKIKIRCQKNIVVSHENRKFIEA